MAKSYIEVVIHWRVVRLRFRLRSSADFRMIKEGLMCVDNIYILVSGTSIVEDVGHFFLTRGFEGKAKAIEILAKLDTQTQVKIIWQKLKR